MSKPFLYDAHVKSQIGHEHDFYGSMRSPQSRKSDRRQLNSKIEDLLSMCKSENQDMKADYGNVMRAER